MNDFDEALKTLFVESVKGLSSATIGRLKRAWKSEYAQWRQQEWQGHEFVYIWADGIYVNVRSDQRRCVLVGCDFRGSKHFRAIEEGFRESAESWRALLLSLRDRGARRRSWPSAAARWLLGGTVGTSSDDAGAAMLGAHQKR